MVCEESVRVYPSNIKMKVGEWYRAVYAKFNPDNAADLSIEWSSSNPSVVDVDPVCGFIYGKNKGIATVYATVQDGSGKMGACTVTVIPKD